MSDELDVLRHDNDVIEPDPQFRAELMDQLRHVMASGSDVAPNALTLPRVASDTTEKDTPHRRHPSRWLAVVAVAACLLAVVAVATVVMSDHQAVDTIDPAEAPTGPASTTTEQYGRVVSEHSDAIQTWINREESSDHIEESFPQYVRERYVELRPILRRFHVTLAELPSPPDEIATLVDETKMQVSDALNSVDLLLSCGAASPYTPCDDERSEADAAYKALPPLFEAWSPYT